MKNNECFSDTCPDCGAQLSSEIRSIPVRRRIQVKREYSCGRRLQYFYEIAGVEVTVKCAGPAGHANTAAPTPPTT